MASYIERGPSLLSSLILRLPSLFRRSVSAVQRTYVPKKRISIPRFCIRMSSRMALRRRKPSHIPTNPHNVISREICCVPTYVLRNPPLNRDLPECLRKEAAVSRYGSRLPVCHLARKCRVITATYRRCGWK